MNNFRESDVFGLQYLEDAELEQNDVTGCASALSIGGGTVICDLVIDDGPMFPTIGL